MSKLNVDNKTIRQLLSDKQSDFLIPDYQRPYAWNEDQCQTLWDDIFTFALPDNNIDKFVDSDEYYLGPIVVFKNDRNKLEVIDGQQRLTTIMLLLRAFYDYFVNMQDEDSISTREMITKCIWKTNRYDRPDYEALKIDSEVATDDDKEEFLHILRTGQISKKENSRYAKNFAFFQQKIEAFLRLYPSCFAHLPAVILNNCILLPIEAESQDTALRIFSTLNDRGLPLSDADIFKAQFYKYYGDKNQKDEFIGKWKQLEETAKDIFSPPQGTPMDELFTRYMYYLRAKAKNKNTTTESLRKFYEKNKYAALKNDQTIEDLISLVNFWNSVASQDSERFSPQVLRDLFILNYAPNSMWTYFISVYYMHNRDQSGKLADADFHHFLELTTYFIWAYALYRPGVNALRTPIFAEMVNIVENKAVTFADYKFNAEDLRNIIDSYSFTNNRAITRSMLTWWAFQNPNQALPQLNTKFELEHIFAKNRQNNEKSLQNPRNLESLGNKALLEKSINIGASDYRFDDKKKYYLGFTTARGEKKPGSIISEYTDLVHFGHFDEAEIEERYAKITSIFLQALTDNQLLA